MRRALASALVSLAFALAVHAEPPRDGARLTRLLHEFLAGASRNDASVHERFWADELIYTGSSGRRVGKAEIMADVRATPAAGPGESATTFTAEDVRVRQYGDTAIVAFRLVGTSVHAGQTQLGRYLNTGTFRKRNGRWQAVSWQATRMPRPDEEARQELTAARAALQRALLAGDAKALAMLLDERFVWTRSGGERLTRQELLSQLAEGPLKDAQIATDSPAVSVYGDAAVLRGADSLTLVNQGEGWKAVALHSSRTP